MSSVSRRFWVIVAVLCLATGCSSSPRSATPATPTTADFATPSEPDEEPVASPMPGATDDVSSLRLPPAGVVVSYSTADRPFAALGVILVGLDGRILANIANGFDLAGYGTAGPLLLTSGQGDFALEDDGGQLRPLTANERRRVPLAYGAEIESRGDGDPSPIYLVAGGKDVASLGNGMGELHYEVANDRDLVTVLDHTSSTMFDLRSGSRRRLSKGCWAADRHGQNLLVLCADSDGRTASVGLMRDGELTTIVGPAAPSGRGWREAMYSNDGTSLLLEWEGPCAQPDQTYFGDAIENEPSAYLADGNSGHLQKVAEGGRVEALGWSPDNEAIVASSFDGYCGDMDTSGVDAIASSGTTRRILSTPIGATMRHASLWRPTLA